MLSALEQDAITELLNIGVSRAAVSLCEMVGDEVLLDVPSVVLMGRAEAIARVTDSETEKLVAVHQAFEGEISGRAMLIFPEIRSLELVRAVLGAELPLEDILDLEDEALAETGNVILNNCVGSLANMLQRTLRMSLPEVLRGDATALFNITPPSEGGDVIMFVYINFRLRRREIAGFMAMLTDLPSLAALQGLLREFIERVTGQEPQLGGS